MVEIITGDRMRRSQRLRILDLGDLTVYPLDWPATEAALREAMGEIARRGALPIILGGDHLITAPLVQGFAEAVRERTGRPIGYVQFSSQLDLGERDPRLGQGVAGRHRAADPRRRGGRPRATWRGSGPTATCASRTGSSRERTTWPSSRWRTSAGDGIARVVEDAAEMAGDGCAAIYASVDFDVLDGGYVAMQGSPRFEGLTNVELLRAMDVLRRTRVGALDLVGLNPTVTMVSVTGQRFGVWLVIRFLAGSALASP